LRLIAQPESKLNQNQTTKHQRQNKPLVDDEYRDFPVTSTKRKNYANAWEPLRNQENTQQKTEMNQKRWKTNGIFLDLDGTIVDSTGAYIEAAKVAFHALGKNPPENKLLLEIPRRIEQHLTIDDLTQGNTKEFMQIYLKAYYSFTEAKTKLFPNIADTLEALSAKSKLALITMRHCPNQVVQKELDYFGIAKYFTHIVTALDTSKPKPSPEALIRCVEALDVEMCDCIIAGDSVNDVRAGKAAGAGTVALLSGLFGREELAKECPDLILHNINELPGYVE
jgi:HAD superfamily hydrolase (TIGR01549 family)